MWEGEGQWHRAKVGRHPEKSSPHLRLEEEKGHVIKVTFSFFINQVAKFFAKGEFSLV